jgi:hypothetical protein
MSNPEASTDFRIGHCRGLDSESVKVIIWSFLHGVMERVSLRFFPFRYVAMDLEGLLCMRWEAVPWVDRLIESPVQTQANESRRYSENTQLSRTIFVT